MPIPDKLYPAGTRRIEADVAMAPVLLRLGVDLTRDVPLYQGGFSALFAMAGAPDRLVRVELLNERVDYVRTRVQRAVGVARRLQPIVPAIYQTEVVPLHAPENWYVAVIAVVERLDIVQWADWGLHFDHDALALATAMMRVFQRMIDAGMAHTDVSPNNIVLTRAGQIKVIDFMDACVEPASLECRYEPVAWTKGFADLTLSEPDDAQGRETMNQIHMLIFGKEVPADMFTRPDPVWDLRRHTLNMIYGAGATLASVLLAAGDKLTHHATRDGYLALPTPVRVIIEGAMTLDYNRRTIAVPNADASVGGHASASSRARPMPLAQLLPIAAAPARADPAAEPAPRLALPAPVVRPASRPATPKVAPAVRPRRMSRRKARPAAAPVARPRRASRRQARPAAKPAAPRRRRASRAGAAAAAQQDKRRKTPRARRQSRRASRRTSGRPRRRQSRRASRRPSKCQIRLGRRCCNDEYTMCNGEVRTLYQGARNGTYYKTPSGAKAYVKC